MQKIVKTFIQVHHEKENRKLRTIVMMLTLSIMLLPVYYVSEQLIAIFLDDSSDLLVEMQKYDFLLAEFLLISLGMCYIYLLKVF